MNSHTPPPLASDAEERPFASNPSLIIAYTAVTVALLLVFAWSLSRLDQAPRLLITTQNRLQPGWKPLTNDAQQFTLHTPLAWVNQPELSRYPSQTAVLEQSLAVYAEADEQLQTQLLVHTETAVDSNAPPDAFVAVTVSPRLRQLTAIQLIDFAQSGMPQLDVVGPVERFAQPMQAQFIYKIVDVEPGYVCIQRFTPGTQAAFIITTCATQDSYPRQSSTLTDIQDSFQELAID